MTDFDFGAMQAEGNDADVPELFVMTMTPLPLDSEPAAHPSPTPLEIHYAYIHQLIQQGAAKHRV